MNELKNNVDVTWYGNIDEKCLKITEKFTHGKILEECVESLFTVTNLNFDGIYT